MTTDGADTRLLPITQPDHEPRAHQPGRTVKGVAEDMADVLSVSERANVPYGRFDQVLMTKEYTPLEPDVVEHKYYARGVGFVLEVTVKGGSDRLALVEVTRFHPVE